MSETSSNYNAGRGEPQRGGQDAPQPKKRKKRRRPLILTIIIRFFQLIGTLILIGVITGTFMICYAAVYVKTVVMPQTYLDLDEYTLNENSVIYYENKTTGQWEELQTLVGDENRELVKYTDIPQDLINAFVAIEDKRFWAHNGVDWKRTAAGLVYMFTGHNIQGGSTIDQQLIKNLTLNDEVTVTRKILEIFKALELEKNYKKEQILTLYLNRIYMGNRCYGVQAAAQFYFGKDVWDLNLAECASLAGITNNPSLYAPYGNVETVRYKCQNSGCQDPYSSEKETVCGSCGAINSFDDGTVWTNREWNKARQETILKEMAKVDEQVRPVPYITEAERDAAIAAPLVFSRDVPASTEEPEDPESPEDEEKKSTVRYSWYVEAVIDDTIEAVMEARQINYETARQLVYNGGLSIYCCYDPEIQNAVDTVYNNRANLDQVSSRTGQRLMSAISVVDNSSGFVVAIGNTMEKTVDRGLNPAVHTAKQPGSSIKPLSVYSPAIEMGLITPASVVDDNPMLLNGKPWPINVSPVWGGLTTVMDGVTKSLNTIAVRVLDMVTPQAAYNFMVERYGITTLAERVELSDGSIKSDIDRSPLSMGGLTYGLTSFEAAAAFATFPRNGAFTPATTIVEVRDSSDRTIIDNRTITENVIQARTAYYINAMLSNAVTSSYGTAGGARISGQTVAGKTGTTNNLYNLWFCGYTNYYTAAVWTGYEFDEQINSTYYNPSITLWQKVMSIVHEGRENSPFSVPGDVATYHICQDCGNLAASACSSDVRGSRVQSFLLLTSDAPRAYCTCHVPVQVCIASPILKADGTPSGYYHKAGEFCPAESIRTVTLVDYQRELATPSVSVGDQLALLSNYTRLGGGVCQVHTSEPIESEEPGESEEPTESPEPGESDPPPTESIFVDPSTPEPTLPPEEPTVEPTPEPATEPPAIPAVDPNQNSP